MLSPPSARGVFLKNKGAVGCFPGLLHWSYLTNLHYYNYYY
jgi:hypothetical protein